MSLPKVRSKPRFTVRTRQPTPSPEQARGSDAIRKVYVEPTTRCNLDCAMCMRHAWDEPPSDMAPDTFNALLESLHALPAPGAIQLSGFGEPLLHERLVDMVQAVGGQGHQAEIVTNGALLGPKLRADLIDAGMNTLIVSIDGLSDSTYAALRSGASLQTVLDNARALKEAAPPDFTLGIEFVAMKRNRQDLAKLHRLARHLGASFVVVTNVLAYAPEMADETLYGCWTPAPFPTPYSEANPLIRLPVVDLAPETSTAIGQLVSQHGNVTLLHHDLNVESPYCRFVNEGRLAVRWDGEVSPCLSLLHSHNCYVMDREKRTRHCSFGNVRDATLRDIWAHPDYVAFRDRVRRFDFPLCAYCGGCEVIDSNEEDCFGNPFPVCGDCLWARGIIQCV